MPASVPVPFKTASHIVAAYKTLLRQRARGCLRALTRTTQRKYRWRRLGNFFGNFFREIGIDGHVWKALPFHANKPRGRVCQIRQTDKGPFGLRPHIHQNGIAIFGQTAPRRCWCHMASEPIVFNVQNI
jgi:hypothetical protein